MRTEIEGTYRGRRSRVIVIDGVAREGEHELALLKARAAVRAGAEVSIPGVWTGTASLDDPYAIRATFLDVLDQGTARFDGDPLPAITLPARAGTVY